MEKDTEILEDEAKFSINSLPFLGLGISLAALLFLITTKSPGSGGPMIILFFLLLSFLGTLCLSSICLNLLNRYIGKSAVSTIRLLYTSVAIASGVVFLVGLQTLRQLQVVDLVLVLAFELLLNFYLLRRF